MQIKKIALAALAVVAAPAFADIATYVDMGQAELVFVAYNDKASFTKDLGITTDAFLAQMNSSGTFNASVLGSEYSRYLAQGGSATQWAVVATNPIGFGFNPYEINYYGTKNVAQGTYNLTNILFNDGVQNLANWFGSTDDYANNAGIGADAGINNIEYTGLAGTIEHAVGYIDLGSAYNTANDVGVASEMFLLTTSSDESTAAVIGGSMGNPALRINFDGAMITATSPVAAIPEPSTYAMLLAGLCAVGFVARRRQA